MEHLTVAFKENGYCFEYMGKRVSEFEVKQSDYILSSTDKECILNDFSVACGVFGDDYRNHFQKLLNVQLDRIEKKVFLFNLD